eukprot:CAMPEP_0206380084 /NCGR_PEP_ID=MMETSP0294-20121207/11795_1 /ASSEMBLY_ACC=CAM_ASM_000327 /TAXON_ID=39354 /ORGANISM="Heterosigma akashiwo, Strain CCMP2393" /LENGTH=163 /DNA_ID=CAMNT_0053829189 /DNA_START=504 /DNA_END=996 /DNA_ORIENTATION=+
MSDYLQLCRSRRKGNTRSDPAVIARQQSAAAAPRTRRSDERAAAAPGSGPPPPPRPGTGSGGSAEGRPSPPWPTAVAVAAVDEHAAGGFRCQGRRDEVRGGAKVAVDVLLAGVRHRDAEVRGALGGEGVVGGAVHDVSYAHGAQEVGVRGDAPRGDVQVVVDV